MTIAVPHSPQPLPQPRTRTTNAHHVLNHPHSYHGPHRVLNDPAPVPPAPTACSTLSYCRSPTLVQPAYHRPPPRTQPTLHPFNRRPRELNIELLSWGNARPMFHARRHYKDQRIKWRSASVEHPHHLSTPTSKAGTISHAYSIQPQQTRTSRV